LKLQVPLMRVRLAARFQRQSGIRSGRTMSLPGRSVIKYIWISRWDLPNPRMILALLERR
jgi:hypothetical protein